MTEKIFALDIGTRSITGIILTDKGGQYEVLDYYTKEHKERAMLDGQIHDIVAVAEVIQDVKDKLEENNGPLNKVCVAAAGRSLKTAQHHATIEINQQTITNEQMVKHLELSAVQNAQKELSVDLSHTYDSYHCVGYSVLHYELDGEKIRSLIDQKGKEASAHVIATFLPKIIVESLLAVLERANLEMEALTLEPIAAISILIPESMRRLNVALIDIGAGTSDIAVTNNETISGYGMVPSAGDEVTEAISDLYLLDFKVAEQFKRDIVSLGEATVQDILGFDTVVSKDELLEKIDSTIESLTEKVTDELFQLNNEAPKAVMLIGGGSLTPEVSERIASRLQLPSNRVAVRGVDAIQNLTVPEDFPSGPDFITPIGIAIAAKQNPVYYIHLTINGQAYRILHMNDLSVSDALIQSGININTFYGPPGLAHVAKVNGQSITIPGELGTVPTLYVNDEEVTVDTIVQDGDVITIKEGKRGKAPHVTIEQLLDIPEKMIIYLNDALYNIEPTVYVNGEIGSWQQIIKDNDDIMIEKTTTLKQFLQQIDDHHLAAQSFTIKVNDKPISITGSEDKLLINGKEAELTTELTNKNRITIESGKSPTVSDLLAQLKLDAYETITVSFNGDPVCIKNERLSIMRHHQALKIDDVLVENDSIKIKEKEDRPFVFQDVFRFIDLDLTKAKGSFTLYKNDQTASFFEPIQDGDELYIKWNANNEKIAKIPK